MIISRGGDEIGKSRVIAGAARHRWAVFQGVFFADSDRRRSGGGMPDQRPRWDGAGTDTVDEVLIGLAFCCGAGTGTGRAGGLRRVW